eukprot:352443-Chlamydomonas_euryale.AAC.7
MNISIKYWGLIGRASGSVLFKSPPHNRPLEGSGGAHTQTSTPCMAAAPRTPSATSCARSARRLSRSRISSAAQAGVNNGGQDMHAPHAQVHQQPPAVAEAVRESGRECIVGNFF